MIELYPHNAVAYEKAKQMMEQCGKAAIVHPTGTGKSYIAFALAEENRNAHVLWLAPNEYIYLTQTKVLFDSQHIRYPNITFMTYPYLLQHKNEIDDINPDFIILDEFHRAGAARWIRAVKELIRMYPNAKMLGLSATNVRYLDNHRDMAEELFDGYIASKMSLCEAMAKEILPTPKYVIGIYRYEERLDVFQSRIENTSNENKKAMSQEMLRKLRKMLECSAGLPELFRKFITDKNKRLIIFCITIGHAFEMIGKVPEWFSEIDCNPHVYCVNSENAESDLELNRFMEDESDHLKLLFCVDMLNEGIHVTGIDGVVLLRPTRSPAVYKQQIGRTLSAGCKVQPIIFDLVNNFDSLYFIESVKEEWEEQRIAYLRQDPEEYEDIEFEIYDSLVPCRELIRSIERNLATPWEIYYEAYATYTEEFNTVRISKGYVTEDGLLLGRWVQRQRSDYRLGRIKKDKEERLDLLGKEWKKERKDRFEFWFEILESFHKEYGHVMVPGNYITKSGERLGSWVLRQRTEYSKGTLSEERKKRLDEMGFCWDVKAAWWEDGYAHAKAFFEEHKDLAVPKSYVCVDGFRLYNWVSRQISVYKGKIRGDLTPDKIKRLEAIGMVWEREKPDDLDRGIAAYRQFVRTYKTTVVPVKYRDGDFHLRKWVEKYRTAYRNGRLDRSVIKKLEQAGFVWEAYVKTWDDRYKEAKEFYKKNGSLVMTCKQIKEEGECLNAWIRNQNKEYMKENHGSLSEEQVRLLEEIQITIRTRADLRWEKGYSSLKEYYAENGDALVPYDYQTDDGFNLGKWMKQQREHYREGKLSDEKKALLDRYEMVWGDMNHVKAELYWGRMYELAEAYYQDKGHLRVPWDYLTDNGEKLGQWIFQQRRIFSGELKHSIKYGKERIEIMNKIGMSWQVTH